MSKIPTKGELAHLLESVSELATYDAGRSGMFNRRELKLLSERDKKNGYMIAALASPMVLNPEMERILPIFRNLLENFVDSETDRVGNGLVGLAGGVLEPTLFEYVQILIRASAVLGGDRTAELLVGWIQGESVKYREISILNGITVEQPLTLREGLQIYQLPLSSNELVSRLPAMSLSFHGLHSMIGQVALSIECEASPAIYRPSKEDVNGNMLNINRAQRHLRNLSVDRLCEAMSLACDGCVQMRYSWRDFGEIQEFLHVYSGMSWIDIRQSRGSTEFTQEHFERAREIYGFLATKIEKRSVDTAVKRWIRSKNSNSSFADQLIDLRIALESLYLNNNDGELRFRLANYSAWHIGQCVQERKLIFQSLSETYKLASRAVHSGSVKENPHTRKLLEDAQKYCRKGILKRLNENAEPNWDDLIMGI